MPNDEVDGLRDLGDYAGLAEGIEAGSGAVPQSFWFSAAYWLCSPKNSEELAGVEDALKATFIRAGRWPDAKETESMASVAAAAGAGADACAVAASFGPDSESRARALAAAAIQAALHGNKSLFDGLLALGVDPGLQGKGPNKAGLPDTPFMALCFAGLTAAAVRTMAAWPTLDIEARSKGPGVRRTAAEFAEAEGFAETAFAVRAEIEARALALETEPFGPRQGADADPAASRRRM